MASSLFLHGHLYGHLFEGIDEAAAERLDEAVSKAAVRIVRGFGEVADLG